MIQLKFDAASCYDRIIPSLSGLISIAMGMSFTNVEVNNKTLQNAKYHLKHAASIHPHYYSHDNPSPVYGSGQGSGNSPFLWCIISSILFDCFSSDCKGTLYTSPDCSTSLKLGMVGFVDDTNGQVSSGLGNDKIDVKTLLTNAEHDAQLWKALLMSSGGLLEPTKCSFHALLWSFRQDGTPTLANTLTPDLEAHLRTLPLLSFQFPPNSTSHKTLGTYQTPNRKSMTQFQMLTQKAKSFRNLFHSIITYPLPTTFLSHKQLSRIQSISTANLIPKLGFNRNTAKAIL